MKVMSFVRSAVLAVLIVSGVCATRSQAQIMSLPQYQNTCRVILSGPSGSLAIGPLSGNIYSYTGSGFPQDAGVLITIDHVILSFSLQMIQTFGVNQIEPTMVLNLYSNNPAHGTLNSSAVQGLQIDQRPIGAPLSIIGAESVATAFQGQNFSRLDYSCSFVRLR